MADQPKDYAEPDPEHDEWDPTGYYRRKAERHAEMEPLLAWLFAATGLIVFVALVVQERTMTMLAIGFAAGLVVGWNFLPQPAWVQNLVAKAKAKISG